METGEEVYQDFKLLRCLSLYGSTVNYLEDRSRYKSIYDVRSVTKPLSAYGRRLYPPFCNRNDIRFAICTHFFYQNSDRQGRTAIHDVAWSPNGKRVFCLTGRDSSRFLIYEAEKFKRTKAVTISNTSVYSCMDWSSVCDLIVAGDDNGYIVLYKSTAAVLGHPEEHHTSQIRSVSFSPNGTRYCSSSDDGSVGIWSIERNERFLTGHRGSVISCHWHPSYSLVASGSNDNSVKLWDPRTGSSALTSTINHKNAIVCVRWSRNGNMLASSARDQTLLLYDIRNPSQAISSFNTPEKAACTIDWHPSCDSLLTAGTYDGSIVYWDVNNSLEPHSIVRMAHNVSPVNKIAWHQLGHILASVGNDGIIKFWCRERGGSTLTDVDVHSQYEYGPRQALDNRDLGLVAASLQEDVAVDDDVDIDDDVNVTIESIKQEDAQYPDSQMKKRARRDDGGVSDGFIAPLRTSISSSPMTTSATPLKMKDNGGVLGNIVLEDGKCLDGETFKDIGFLKADSTGKFTDSAKEETAARRVRQQGFLHTPIMPLSRKSEASTNKRRTIAKRRPK